MKQKCTSLTVLCPRIWMFLANRSLRWAIGVCVTQQVNGGGEVETHRLHITAGTKTRFDKLLFTQQRSSKINILTITGR